MGAPIARATPPTVTAVRGHSCVRTGYERLPSGGIWLCRTKRPGGRNPSQPSERTHNPSRGGSNPPRPIGSPGNLPQPGGKRESLADARLSLSDAASVDLLPTVPGLIQLGLQLALCCRAVAA